MLSLRCAAAAFAPVVIALGGGAAAQEYPAKSIRFIVPYSPGGGTDLLARIVGKKLAENWGQQVVVDNRVGAGGIIGTELVAKAPPDGYTLLVTASTHSINPGLFKKLPYDPIKDFAAIGPMATGPNILVVHPSLPARSTRDLIALAKKRPGELTFASAGIGSTTHLAGELFKSLARIEVVHVPYKGSGQAQIDLVGGQVSYMIDSVPSALPRVKAGKTVALATTGKQRFAALPDLPTVAESGLPGYESISWWGLLAPAGTPQPIIIKLNNEVARIIKLPDVKELIATQGVETWGTTPQQFLDFIKEETGLYARIIREAGIKVE
jgi:tripartite-type tricarboxylate transporter receptor subunit TctC